MATTQNPSHAGKSNHGRQTLQASLTLTRLAAWLFRSLILSLFRGFRDGRLGAGKALLEALHRAQHTRLDRLAQVDAGLVLRSVRQRISLCGQALGLSCGLDLDCTVWL